MKILITGSNGQLGKEIIKNQPFGVDLLKTTKAELDLKEPNKCYEYVMSKKPDWVINCAAYTNVEKAESDKDLSYLINSLSVKSLAEATKRIDSNLIQFSTDYVFNGKKKQPYLPDDLKSPLNIYGQTKSFGEDYVKDIFNNSSKGIVIRTSWLMSSIGNNFATKILKLLAKNDRVNIINDQIGAPTSTKILAKACWQAIKLISGGKTLPPILQITNSGEASWYDIAVEIYKTSKEIGLLDNTVEINPIKTSEYKSKVIRPYYSVLDCKESFEELLMKSYDWEKAIKDLISDYQKGI